MDFISNLIKRPISLVLNETSSTMDKYQISSASLPNTPSELEHKKDSKVATDEKGDQHNNERPLSLSLFSSNDENVTDFIGVPEEFLDEFKDILPPPSLSLQSSNSLTQSLLDMELTRPLSITPPPPPLTSSMKASQTIDELLSQINDNLQQAGFNDEVLAIASPPYKSELSSLSSKAALNNSKVLNSSSATNTQINTSKTSTKAAGPASLALFENNSSLHKVPLDPELESSKIADDEQHATKVQMNNSGVNKSSNKFVGLTEFDEAKIPELPGDLNPNIEEQYNVTFEKCFVPTFKLNDGSADTDEECKVDKMHFLLPSEVDVTSDNETFTDCIDETDPLASTFTEPASLNVTTDVESYQSAYNNNISENFNNTMDNIADITLEAEVKPSTKSINQSQVAETQNPIEAPMYEDEAMDVDMNITMEMLHKTSNNIQHVEIVLQHAENIMQHLDDKKSLSDVNSENSLLGNAESTSENEDVGKEKELSKHEISLNKSIEFDINKTKMECHNQSLTLNKTSEVNIVTEINPNLPNNVMNLSTNSNSSVKSAGVLNKTENNLNIHLNLDTSINSQKSSAPNSPTFPMKTTPNSGFPRSPKAVVEKHIKSHFMEKSDYLANIENQAATTSIEKSPLNSLNGNETEPTSGKINNLNGTFLESSSTVDNTIKRRTFAVVNSNEDHKENDAELRKKRQTFSMNSLDNEKTSTDKRRTFNVNANEMAPKALSKFPSMDTAENKRLTFTANENNLSAGQIDRNRRLTFNAAIEQAEPSSTVHNSDEGLKEHGTQSRQNFSMNMLDNEKASSEKRRTFNVNTYEVAPNILSRFPSMDEAESKCLTFNANDNNPNNEHITNENNLSGGQIDINSRLTFNVPIEQTAPDSSAQQTGLNTSFEPMEVDENNISQNTTIPMSEVEQESTHTSISTEIMEKSQQSPLNCNEQQSSESPISSVIDQKSPSPRNSAPKPASSSVSRSQSPTISILQPSSQSHSLPTTQPRSASPPPSLTDLVEQNKEINMTESPNHDMVIKIKQEKNSPSTTFESINSSFASQPLSALIQKRPSIRDARARAADILSAKEQSNIKVKDEKDVFVEKSTPSPIDEVFTGVSATSTTLTNSSGFSGFDQVSSSCSSVDNYGEEQTNSQPTEYEFSGNNLILNPSDFDYLLTKGNNNAPVDRSSLLLKFDPLLGVPVPANQGQLLQIATNTNSSLSPTLEEDEHNESNRSFVIDIHSGASAKLLRDRSQEIKQQLQLEQKVQQNRRQLKQEANKKNATMSVDVIKDMSLDNDCNKNFENSNSTQADDKQINYKMDELEKKIKNEVLKTTDDIEKKLKDAEQREEALIKRITEKDKTIAKMTGVIEAYEKAIAELIADKEQLTQNYEKQLAEVKADRDSNYHHLTSLETTFSDLHVKYEKSKEMTCQLKESEESLQAEKRKNLENLHLQEQRYDKMKNHAMQQLEIANKKLESLSREHSIEITKLKALLKKEEIARSSINEQLTHKTIENAELVKICDELISGQGSNFSFEPFDPKKH